MSTPLKRRMDDNFEEEEESWENTQAFEEEIDETQESNENEENATAGDHGEEAEEATEPAAPTTQTTAPARRPKKPRRGKNSPEPNYSEMVQGQMSTTNRTGQACDRCKGRKMKCDSNSTGCANCKAGNLPCTQTDPITRVSHVRGELELLRADRERFRADRERLMLENQRLRARNESLERFVHVMRSTSAPTVPTFGGGGNQNPTMQQQFAAYDDLLASHAQADARAQVFQEAAQRAGPSFPITYPQNSQLRSSETDQFGALPGASQYSGYQNPMGHNPYDTQGTVPMPHQTMRQGTYRSRTQRQGTQRGTQQEQSQQGYNQDQGEDQEETVPASDEQENNSGLSQDPSHGFKYFPDI